MRIFRHGDVIFHEVEKVPAGNVTRTDDKIEVRGETGNVHSLKGVKVMEIDLVPYVVFPDHVTTIEHPQHPPLEFPPLMVARVERVRSVTPYMD